MSDELKCNEFVEILRKDFGALRNCRPRGNSIEIITPFSTATQKFISVFITVRDGAFIVSDGGWLVGELALYEIPDSEDESESSLTLDFFIRNFRISTFKDRSGGKFFYKRCKEMSLISSAV